MGGRKPQTRPPWEAGRRLLFGGGFRQKIPAITAGSLSSWPEASPQNRVLVLLSVTGKRHSRASRPACRDGAPARRRERAAWASLWPGSPHPGPQGPHSGAGRTGAASQGVGEPPLGKCKHSSGDNWAVSQAVAEGWPVVLPHAGCRGPRRGPPLSWRTVWDLRAMYKKEVLPLPQERGK